MTILELKEKLNMYLEELDGYEDNQEVKIKTNTYWCHGDFLSISSKGFICFNDLVDEDEFEDEDNDNE